VTTCIALVQLLVQEPRGNGLGPLRQQQETALLP
jgi:hypothetical protein